MDSEERQTSTRDLSGITIIVLRLNSKELNLMTLRSRYANMYIPSDFFNAACRWSDAFPIHRPFRLGQSCQFHVVNKDVEPLIKSSTVLEPADADHLYSAKVRALSYRKCCRRQNQICANILELRNKSIKYLVSIRNISPTIIFDILSDITWHKLHYSV